MKRLGMLPLLAVGLVAVGCFPQPPPGWQPPKVQSVVFSTTEIDAGSSFTVTITVTDDHSVAEVGFSFSTDDSGFGMAVPCQGADWEPGPVVTIEATCTMPAIAANGGWRLKVSAIDAEFSGGGEGACGCGWSNTAFTVTGGTEDRQRPTVESIVISPQPPFTVGTPFTATVQASDEHPGDWDQPLSIQYHPQNANVVYCVQTSHTTLTANLHEWTFSCPGVAPPASFAVLTGFISDAMGYTSQIYQWLDLAA